MASTTLDTYSELEDGNVAENKTIKIGNTAEEMPVKSVNKAEKKPVNMGNMVQEMPVKSVNTAGEMPAKSVNIAENMPVKIAYTKENETTTDKKNVAIKNEPVDKSNIPVAENQMPREKVKIAEIKSACTEPQFENEIELNASDDISDCKLYACALIPPGQIILADAGNKKVKVVDIKQEKLIENYKLDSEPFSIAVIREDLIAVTLQDEKKIKFLNVSKSGKLQPSYEMKVDSECKGLACKDKKLLILYEDHVDILNDHGQVINQITHSVWDCLMGIALSHDSKTFYVTDSPLFGNARVYKFDFEGNLLATYKDEGLVDVRGVCITQEGTVFVCNYDNNGSIHIISPECKKIQEVLKSDGYVRYPWCVSYCDETEKLYLCNNELELDVNLRNQLKIFHLKG